MAYEDPLAYLLGIEGTALLRAFTGEFDREFTETRLAEVRRLLDDESLIDAGVEVGQLNAVDGYRVWAGTYDEPRNGMFDFEEPHVREILDSLPPGDALDAACGTGRYTEYLTGRGHRVIGVDSSPDMLARARERVPDADLRAGELHCLPVADTSVDVVVCALALVHLPWLGPAMTEFARVLRPGGHLVISDAHHEAVALGSIPAVRGPDGRPGRLPAHRHRTGDYLRAALPLGFRALACEEPRLPATRPTAQPTEEPGPWQLWPWSLAGMAPEAAWAAHAGRPVTVVWWFAREPVAVPVMRPAR